MAAIKTGKKHTTKSRNKLTLHDRLSRLSLREAVKLLGDSGEDLIHEGAKFEFPDLEEFVYLRGDLFRLTFPLSSAIVTITIEATAKNRLRWNCDSCDRACEHVGAAFSLILEEKMALGLSTMPHEQTPFELLDPSALTRRARPNASTGLAWKK